MKESSIKSTRKNRSLLAGSALIIAWSMLITGCSMKYSSPSATDSSVAAYYDSDMTKDTVTMGTMNSAQSYSKSAAYGAEEGTADRGGGAAEREIPVDESSLEVEKAQKESSRKLIRNANITMETTRLDELAADITQKTKELGGYIEYSWVGDTL